ncbi:hypothetical protein [Bradyrhizobium sp.]|uniref:hypothetical protein n=1 Tax=Bradyrhizobium sp. TaxID=376 RepID=UPI002615BFBB|nr:hypothetical protein [Bradyrhizobium sp.]
MTEKANDPIALWQKTISEIEKGLNAFANQAMGSPEFSKMMNQAGGITAGAQNQFRELMERYLLMANLPSRAQLIGIAERLQTIETQLNDMRALLQQVTNSTSAQRSPTNSPRPPRTKRPPQPTS